MTQSTEPKRKRLGLLGQWTGPVAQLLQEVYHGQDIDFVAIADPLADAKMIDQIIVLSQAHALAHMRELIATGLKCQILLRRQGLASEEPSWRSSIDWFVECLNQVDWPHFELLALTPAAAQDLTTIVGRPVTALKAIPRIVGRRPLVQVTRNQEFITFSVDVETGNRETRRAQLDIFNWVRLRRLALIRAGDASDLDMADLVEFANGVETSAPQAPPTPEIPLCILVVVPNGIGLGHVTRMMAIATALKEDQNARVVFWSFSRAAEIMQAAGFEVILRQTAAHLSAHPPDWRQWETLEFSKAIKHLQPNVISYDGGTFDMFMIDALRTPGCGRCGVLWVRRGMLRPETDAQLLEMEQYCDLVLEPGDLAVEMDVGPTRTRQAQNRGFSRQIITRPVTLKPFLPAYPRKQALRQLGLGRGRHCLVSLGGAFGDWDLLKRQLFDCAKKYRVNLVWAHSPLAPLPDEEKGGAKIRQFYPLNRFFNAFDGMVTATGYNSYHELMLSYTGPVLLAPTNHGRLDDQVARATYAGNQNWASVVYADQPQDQSGVIDAFMQQVQRRDTISTRPAENYAGPEMVSEILSVCQKYR